MIMGWASGTFGLFGLNKQSISIPWLNFLGLGISVLALLIFMNIKTNDTSVDSKSIQISSTSVNEIFIQVENNTIDDQFECKDNKVLNEIHSIINTSENRSKKYKMISSIDYTGSENIIVIDTDNSNAKADSSNRIFGLILATIAG